MPYGFNDDKSKFELGMQIKSITFSGKTNSIGMIAGSLSDFGINDGSFILGAYFTRSSFNAYRKIKVFNYGGAGFALQFTETNSETPVNAKSVSCTIYYV
jgi:hypothetical protein